MSGQECFKKRTIHAIMLNSTKHWISIQIKLTSSFTICGTVVTVGSEWLIFQRLNLNMHQRYNIRVVTKKLCLDIDTIIYRATRAVSVILLALAATTDFNKAHYFFTRSLL